jgi:predicted GIY-YIG superfamily endonuclease
MTIDQIMWQVEPRKSLDSEIIRSKIKTALLIQEDYYKKRLNEQKEWWLKACAREDKKELVDLLVKR